MLTPTLEDVRVLMARATGDEKHDESSTSTLDALWVLHRRVLRLDPADPMWEGRDRFVLSKGHGPVAYYAILAAMGFFAEDWLDGFMDHDGRLGSHPDRLLVPGVEASTGSLGHGLPIAVGVALGLRAKGSTSRTVVLCGDAVYVIVTSRPSAAATVRSSIGPTATSVGPVPRRTTCRDPGATGIGRSFAAAPPRT